MEHGAGPGTQEEASTSGAAQQPLFSWNVARWALGARGTQQPPPAVASAAAASLSPHAAGQVSAAAEAAAALTAWEEAKASRRGYGGGGGGVAAPASLVQQPQQQLADAQFAAADDFDEEEFEEEEEEEGEWDTYRPLKLLLAGGVAGAVSRTATAPIDRLKMLLQIQDCSRGLTIQEGIRKMTAEGSVRSFFKGNGTNVVKIAPETAIKLTLNDALKQVVASDPDEITPMQRMTAGALAGACAQSTIYPFELVRTRLAVCPSGTYRGIADCVRKVLAQEGWRAFYRGMVPSMLGILPYAGVDITIFELLKERLLDEYEGTNPPAHMILAAGMCSSSIAQFAAYPLALTRTRLQAQGIGGRPIKYRGMMDVLRKTVANEGVRGLYKGSLTNLAKVAPAAGISWLVFEQAKQLMSVDPRR
ncbi:Calcium-binding mitochondrial carrier S [Micractinium conductrix]|uniref:Calcium-binding mitochondrial carrier S n=1 Tax=Micractinium conductrix TaxID=554055 RepID=A0A2P6V3U1_9CHLO|nr:Calcium-binding mitochondrial carrier S [Micractinium conductrix]|eukprot:PSC68761.1 Calcium-binding mitochondrial carrier S [Micractinium conductrix]